MNVGKTLFAQIMEFVPWTSFARIVDRYSGNERVRRMSCAEQFRVMAFAQLTWRESLRDIEVTLGANANKRYAMGLRHAVHRSTLADANESRDWRIWSDIAALLIRRARKLYRDEDLGLDLRNTVYALDATTIDLCLSLFDWAAFRSTKAAIKMHTLLDLRGAIPAFIHISDGKLHEVNVLDLLPVEAGAFYVMDRGYLDFARLYQLHQLRAFFVTRAKRGMDARRVYSEATDRATGVICDQRIALNGFYVAKDYPEHLRRIRYRDPDSGKTLVFLTNNMSLPPLTIAALYKSRWQVELFFKWIKQHLRIKKFLGTSENAVKTQIWCAVSTWIAWPRRRPKYGCAVHAYVLMTNHVHLLLTPSNEEGPSRLMQAVGRRYVQYVNYTYRRSGTLWEGRFKASLVQAEDYLLSCYRYIELNPVRAGMVDQPEQYRWSSHRAHMGQASNQFLTDHVLFEALGTSIEARQKVYRALFDAHLDPIEEKVIRQSARNNWPTGSDRFKEQIETMLERRLMPGRRGRPRKLEMDIADYRVNGL